MKKILVCLIAVALWIFSTATIWGQNLAVLNMGFSGAGIGSDLLKVIDRSALWRKHGLEVRTVYLSSGTLMAQTLSSGDIGIAGFDTPAMLNLALAGQSLKVIAVPINRLEPFFVVRSNIKTPADLKGKKITISRFGSGSDIMALGGFGGGWFHPQSLAILSTKYRDQKAFALGVHDSSANLGEVVGPLTIGFLLNFFDWRTSLQIWAIPGLCIGVLYATFGREGNLAVPRPRDYRRAVWEDVLKNKAVFSLVAVSTLRAMGQTALAAFLPLYLSLHLKLPASIAGAYMLRPRNGWHLSLPILFL